jgi:pyruvate/2-oxoglutarate dehydrogenase complex dihydrolipoamide acyltransferase (E2) component
LSPSPIKRLKPYFKTRPRAGATPAAAAQPPAAPPAAAAAAAPAPAAPPPAPAAPPPAPAAPTVDGAALEARREQLARRYEELQADLGGLVYEMAIRDHFRLDVVVRRAAALQAVDAELSSVEQQLGISSAAPTAACPSCGGPVSVAAQYCGRCGSTLARPAIASTPVSAAAGAPAPGGPVQ